MAGPEIRGRISADGRGWTQGLRKAKQEANSFSTDVKSIFASGFSGGGIGGALKTSLAAVGVGIVADWVAGMANEFKEQIKGIKLGTLRTGLDVDTFQRFNNLMEATGVGMDSLAAAMDHVAQAQQHAKQGGVAGAEAMKQFALLGASAADVQNKSFQDLTVQIFRYLQGVEMAGDRVAALKDVFGRGGTNLIPAMKMGLDSPTAQKGLIDDEDVRKAALIKKSFAESGAFWSDVGVNFQKAASNILDGIKLIGTGKVTGTIWKAFFGDDKRSAEAIKDRVRMQQQQQVLDVKDQARQKEQADAAKRNAAFDEQEEKDQEAYAQALEDANKEAERLEKQGQERQEQNKFNAMSPEEKKSYLEDKLAKAQADGKAAFEKVINGGNAYDRLAFAKSFNDEQSIQAQLAALNNPAANKETGGMRPLSDRLSNVGMFTGASGAAGSTANIGSKMDRILAVIDGKGIILRN